MSLPEPAGRPRFAGVRQIARYNWPQYAVSGLIVLAAGGLLLFGRPGPPWLRPALWLAWLPAAWWAVASLAASHWIYDRSELYRWTWIPSVLAAAPRRWLHLHAGLDESSAALRQLYPRSAGTVGDFFDPAEMSEPSIARARAEQSAPSAQRVPCRKFPFADDAFDTVFLLFAAHELRRAPSREAFFGEIHRVLSSSGAVLLVEHARDLANFAAFGPGFFHFLPAREWRRLADLAGLEVVTQKRLTPFVRIIQLRKTS